MNEIPSPISPKGLSIDGELTIYTAAQWHQSLLDVLARPGDVTLDLGNVSEIDAAGVQLLIAAQREVKATERELHITSQSKAVRQALEFCCMAGFFGAPAPHAAAAGE